MDKVKKSDTLDFEVTDLWEINFISHNCALLMGRWGRDILYTAPSQYYIITKQSDRAFNLKVYTNHD